MDGPVQVSDIVLAGLTLVKREGIEDRWDAIMFLFMNGNDEAADWISTNRADYWAGQTRGFVHG